MIRIGILGANGRMGRTLIALLESHPRLALAASWSRGDDLDAVIQASDVVIDFTRPELTAEAALACARWKKPFVSGTTGLDDVQHQSLAAVARDIPVLHAANMSIGVNLLLHLVHEAAARLGDDYDAEIVETHHRHKVDAPSGTAIALGRALADARGGVFEDLVDYGRHGKDTTRTSGRIGVHSLRAGEIVGEHDVRLIGPDEEIRFGHTAFRRETFAAGALRAAEWIHGREPGLYGMRDLLDLS